MSTLQKDGLVVETHIKTLFKYLSTGPCKSVQDCCETYMLLRKSFAHLNIVSCCQVSSLGREGQSGGEATGKTADGLSKTTWQEDEE